MEKHTFLIIFLRVPISQNGLLFWSYAHAPTYTLATLACPCRFLFVLKKKRFIVGADLTSAHQVWSGVTCSKKRTHILGFFPPPPPLFWTPLVTARGLRASDHTWSLASAWLRGAGYLPRRGTLVPTDARSRASGGQRKQSVEQTSDAACTALRRTQDLTSHEQHTLQWKREYILRTVLA